MKRILLILILASGNGTNLFGQSDSVKSVQRAVNQINNNSLLQEKEFDTTKIYRHTFDGGGIIKLYFDQKGLKKIKQEIGLSYGRVTTIIYFNKNEPIKIIDREENFKWLKDNSGWDYSELNQVFQKDVYIYDWEMENIKIIKRGKRKLSKETYSIFEYKPLIELGNKLMKK